MTGRTLGGFVVAASVAALLSCTGTAGSPAATTSATATSIGPLVLTDKGCTYQGPAQVKPGSVALQMTNETKVKFNLDVWRLNDGHTYAELAAHIKEEQRRAATGEPELGHPSFAGLFDQESLASGTETKTIRALTPGTYGFVCIAFAKQGPGAIWVAGPLVVAA